MTNVASTVAAGRRKYRNILASWRRVRTARLAMGTTYRQQNVAKVHQNHDHAADPGEIRPVAADDEQDGDTVMRIHLPVVLAPLFDVDDEQLMAPETELGQIVEFCEARERRVGIVPP